MILLLAIVALPVLFAWFLFAIVVGIAAERRQQSFVAFLAFSLFFSPLFGALLLWAMGDRRDGARS